jgi:hypothetical protein
MTEPLVRDNVIELLKRLGSDQDEEVLEAARQLHALIPAAGMTWEDLLVPDVPDDGDDVEYQDTESEAPEPPAETAKKDADSLALIDELLAKPGISEPLCEELENYKNDIAEGEFDEADRRYVRAVHERLSKRR